MKKFRVVYWLGSMLTERIVHADSAEDVKKMFGTMLIKAVDEI